MSKLWCIGKRYDYLVSNTTVASSTDGQVWTPIESPFAARDAGTNILYHNNAIISFSGTGNISRSSDFSTWQRGDIGVQGFYVSGSVSASKAIACGQRHYIEDYDGYAAGTEVAQIFNSETGEPNTWSMIFTSGYQPSGFYNIKYFASADIGNNILSPVVVAVGQKYSLPYVCYSTDLGQTWTELFVEDSFTHAFLDVDYNQSSRKWYFATTNYLAEIASFLSPVWSTTQVLDTNLPITKLKINPQGACCAITAKSIWYSTTIESWMQYTNTGYQWRSIEWYNDRWIAGAESLLTRYTFWTSEDGITWISNNNQVQMMSFTQSS